MIAVILFVMIRSVGRGFVSSFIHLLGLAAACIVAALLSGKAAAWLYDGYLAERLQTAVSDTLRQKLQTFAELLDRIDPTDTITGAAGDALRTVMVALLTMVAFLVIFLVAMVIVRALAKLTRNVNRVPVVGGVNRVLGGVLGALGGMVYAVGTGSAVPDQYQNANTFLAYAALILGGAARVLGPVVGSMILLFILQFADTGLRTLISNGIIPEDLLSSTDVAQIRFILVGVGLMLLLIFRPQGIFGDRREVMLDAR